MKKIAFLTSCFVGLGLMMPGVVRAGDFYEIKVKGGNFTDANEYVEILNGWYVECDDDDGDADDGVVVYKIVDQRPAAKKCVIEWNGDFWTDVDGFEKCDSDCDDSVALGGGYKVCANGTEIRPLAGGAIGKSSGACWYED